MVRIWLNCCLSKGYEVHGMIRRASTFNTRRIDHIYHDPHGNGEKVHLYLHYGDLIRGWIRFWMSSTMSGQMKFTTWQRKVTCG